MTKACLLLGTRCWSTSGRTPTRNRTSVPSVARAFPGWRTWKYTPARTQVRDTHAHTHTSSCTVGYCFSQTLITVSVSVGVFFMRTAKTSYRMTIKQKNVAKIIKCHPGLRVWKHGLTLISARYQTNVQQTKQRVVILLLFIVCDRFSFFH